METVRLAILLGVLACKPGEEADIPLEYAGGAVESLPQVEDDGAAGMRTSLPLPEGTIADFEPLRRFFKRECHMVPQANYCPPDVDVDVDGEQNAFKFSSTTLLGLIFHAELYGGGQKVACDLNPGTVTPASFVAAEPPGDPDKYLLDTYALYRCRGESPNVIGDDSGLAYQAYSVDPDFQATLTTRYHVPYSGGPNQNDFFQVYVTVTDGEPVLLAFNNAGVSTHNSRAVLIVNLVTHRFAVKYQTLDTATDFGTFVNAIGVGGVDRESGADNEGHYFTQFSDGPAEGALCVNNVGQLLETTEEPCTAEGVPVAWDDRAAVATYLDLSAAEQTRLAAFLDVLSDGEPLGPEALAQSADEAETNFPKAIQ